MSLILLVHPAKCSMQSIFEYFNHSKLNLYTIVKAQVDQIMKSIWLQDGEDSEETDEEATAQASSSEDGKLIEQATFVIVY